MRWRWGKRRFSDCVVVINPASTHYQKAARLANELQQQFSPQAFRVIETSTEDYQDTDRLLAKLTPRLNEHTLLCIAGGDGTISLIVNLLLTRSDVPAKARRAIILPLWGGNANDFAHMINGPMRQAKLAKVVRKGKITEIHPLSVRVKHKGRSRTRLAVCYVSFGASARAGELIGRPAHRHRRLYRFRLARLVSEMAIVTYALARTKPFLIEIDGQQRKIFDLVMINGSRMARLSHLPSKITQPGFAEFRSHNKQPLLIPYYIRLAQTIAFTRHTFRNKRSFTLREAVWMQVDGEVQQVREYSQVSVEASDQTFRVLASKSRV